MRLFGMAVAVLALSTSSASAQTELGDVGKGRALAQKDCAECHAETREPAKGRPVQAKSFQDIARSRGRTGLSMRVFLRSEHKDMPRLILTEAETDDIIAYILSLK